MAVRFRCCFVRALSYYRSAAWARAALKDATGRGFRSSLTPAPPPKPSLLAFIAYHLSLRDQNRNREQKGQKPCWALPQRAVHLFTGAELSDDELRVSAPLVFVAHAVEGYWEAPLFS